MDFHGGIRGAFLRNKDGQQPRLTGPLVKRVLGYARPYRWQIAVMLGLIVLTTGLGLLRPLIFRDLIDNTLPNKDLFRLNLLAVGLFVIPLIGGAIRVFQR